MTHNEYLQAISEATCYEDADRIARNQAVSGLKARFPELADQIDKLVGDIS
ncbi:hypothetical protein SAMN05444374_10252 [Rhodococcoides kroppenstedtii]|uniref:Uncharacterized protein n=1 Tax=Rhodococcoides kroppenstedtii TaxID=293050 RepID=A0A1I0SP36_9NOCA|nr:hypothetical protein [Rhodococcus kroppenstedtii]MBT1193296.1 hypothetical protein [Rhodococcus kroppenstedtii]SFA41278.1 hypothetical protein SAMN05444374_10252 [Rhodococcus kroppenstedtii]